jgi:hypothetical protein
MESTGEPGRIHVSESFMRNLPAEEWLPTGGVEVSGQLAHPRRCLLSGPPNLVVHIRTQVKGKGIVQTAFLRWDMDQQ